MLCNKCKRNSGYTDWHCCICVSPIWVKCDSCNTTHHCCHVCYKSKIKTFKNNKLEHKIVTSNDLDESN